VSALDLEGVHTYRGAAHVLQGVSLKVGEGEAVCLVGRNGAGKTTTIESAMGLLTVRTGRIVLQGRDITRLPTHERARLGIGYAPEDAGIFPDLTVAENFQISQTLGATRKTGAALGIGEVDDRVFALFPEVRQFLQRRGLNLSGGQKKMVAIARALTLSPSVLLLDEPFEGLAPVVVSRFIDAARRIKEMGVSLLIAESNLATASRIADRLYAIDRGEIIFQGDPGAAMANEEVMGRWELPRPARRGPRRPPPVP
jgi:branched-chain amino acid transport system ATP-binding protein